MAQSSYPLSVISAYASHLHHILVSVAISQLLEYKEASIVLLLVLIMEELSVIRIPPNFQLGSHNYSNTIFVLISL